MSNRVIDEYLDRVRAHLGALPERERDTILDEMRAHLEEGVQQRLAARPRLAPEAAALEETRAFGEPAEIAAMRAPPPGSLGEPEAPPPRRIRGPRWALALGGLALLALVVILVASSDPRPGADSYQPYHRGSTLVNHTGLVNETFEIRDGTGRFYLDVSVQHEAGCAGIRVTDSHGYVVLDEWDACGGMAHVLDLRRPSGGRWHVEIRFGDFTGGVRITAYATS